jgi:hypothetical protein
LQSQGAFVLSLYQAGELIGRSPLGQRKLIRRSNTIICLGRSPLIRFHRVCCDDHHCGQQRRDTNAWDDTAPATETMGYEMLITEKEHHQ